MSKDAELLALADTLAAAYREYSELGEALMVLRDRQSVRHRELAEVAEQFGHSENAMPDTPSTGESLAGSRLLLALATDLMEILLFSSDGLQETQAAQSSGRDERMARLDEEIARVRNLLRRISELQRTPKDEQWFARLSGVFESVTNLLDNALKFTPPGGQITLAAMVTANGDLDISVRDTGIGIAPKDHEMVLTVFGQADSGLDRSYEGAGLGLPLVKCFVEMHGAR